MTATLNFFFRKKCEKLYKNEMHWKKEIRQNTILK